MLLCGLALAIASELWPRNVLTSIERQISLARKSGNSALITQTLQLLRGQKFNNWEGWIWSINRTENVTTIVSRDPFLSSGQGINSLIIVHNLKLPADHHYPGSRVHFKGSIIEASITGETLKFIVRADTMVVNRSDGALPPPDINIALRRLPCMGDCPVYTIRFDTKMKQIIWDGEANVKQKGRVTMVLSSEQIRQIGDILTRVSPWTLDDYYNSSTESEDMTIKLEIEMNGKKKGIQHNSSDLTAPERLILIENLLEDFAKMAQLIN